MLTILKNKQITYLFLTSFTVLFTGLGLFPILPLFAAQFHAGKTLIGLYFAIIYAANALGPLAVGWSIKRFSKRAVLIAGGLIGLPALALLASARSFPVVIGLTALLWFSGGVIQALVSILTGLHVAAGSQGKAYSLMALTGPFGTLVGGLFVSRLVTWQGYSWMFAALAGIWSIIPLIGWLRVTEGRTGPAKGAGKVPIAAKQPCADESSPRFAWLLVLAFVGALTVNLSRFGASLSMQAARFSPETVSNAAIIGGLVAIPFTLSVGALSDRLGRKHFFGIGFLFILSSALILMGASAVWQYWLASILNMIAFSVSGAMAQALTGEMVPSSRLDQSLSRLNILISAANILCFAAGGLLFDLLGLPLVFLFTALIALAVVVGVEIFIRPARIEGTSPLEETC